MKKYFCYLATITLLISCNQKQAGIASKYLNANNLSQQLFRIDTKRDTILYSDHGIKITIDANSISADGEFVTLQIKEAINLEEMLKAGLTTQSENGILSSDGMFFISTVESSLIKQAIKISLPAVYADERMKLYKGIEKDNKLIWKDPLSLDKSLTDFTDSGKKLFEANCAQCHNPLKTITGPPLAWIDQRRNKKWLYNFVQNNVRVLASGDEYACCIYNTYGRTPMNIFPGLDTNSLDAIFAYIDKDAKQHGIPENFNPNPNCESCNYFRKYYAELMKVRDSLIIDNGSMTKIKIAEPPDTDPNADMGGVPLKVDPQKFNSEYYQFKIEAYGWYNIDDLLEGRFGSVECNLKVRLPNNFTERINVFLVLPAYKVFNEGGLLDNGTEYGFYQTNGRIYLPQSITAFVFAIGEENGKLFFGSTRFITSLSQTINISIAESSKEAMMNFFASTNAKNANFNIEKVKNFESLKKIDEKLKDVQFKISNCSCGGGKALDTLYNEPNQQ